MSSRKRSRTGHDFDTFPGGAFTPRMNLYERTDSMKMVTVTVTLELSGLTRDDVTIDLLHDKLTISGESADQQPQEEGRYISREVPYGKFSRVLTVSRQMKPEDIKARMENGLLTLTYPKDPPKQKPHRIPIE